MSGRVVARMLAAAHRHAVALHWRRNRIAGLKRDLVEALEDGDLRAAGVAHREMLNLELVDWLEGRRREA